MIEMVEFSPDFSKISPKKTMSIAALADRGKI